MPTFDADGCQGIGRGGRAVRSRNCGSGMWTIFSALFSRVSIDLGGTLRSRRDSLPTDKRLMRMAAGEADPGLAALYFQLGRYLLDFQLAAGRHGGESARHLGRRDLEPVELRLPREHQRADELLARGDDEPRRVRRAAGAT